MRLAHLHIRRLLPYHEASSLQERLIQAQFRHKDLVRQQKNHLAADSAATTTPPPPPPTILTFSTPPTYTVGRRYLPSLSSSSSSSSSSTSSSSSSSSSSSTTTTPSPSSQSQSPYTLSPSQIATLIGPPHKPLATFSPSPRGGLLTYHGPGQLTAYPILNLRTHHLTPNCYVRRLEEAVMRTCAAVGVANVRRTGDPGVWVDDAAGLPAGDREAEAEAAGEGKGEEKQPRKICAVGVQVRRGITGHGVGLNVVDEEAPAEYTRDGGAAGYLSWGFGRIVACGLEGKGVTWLGREGMRARIGVEEVAEVFVRELARGLDGVDGVDRMNEDDVQ